MTLPYCFFFLLLIDVLVACCYYLLLLLLLFVTVVVVCYYYYCCCCLPLLLWLFLLLLFVTIVGVVVVVVVVITPSALGIILFLTLFSAIIIIVCWTTVFVCLLHDDTADNVTSLLIYTARTPALTPSINTSVFGNVSAFGLLLRHNNNNQYTGTNWDLNTRVDWGSKGRSPSYMCDYSVMEPLRALRVHYFSISLLMLAADSA